MIDNQHVPVFSVCFVQKNGTLAREKPAVRPGNGLVILHFAKQRKIKQVVGANAPFQCPFLPLLDILYALSLRKKNYAKNYSNRIHDP